MPQFRFLEVGVTGKRTMVATVLGLSAVVSAAPAKAQSAAQARVSAEQKQSRYQIGVMERVLEGAVEHGVTVTRDRLQAVLPAEIQLISENARVRGFRLEGYGLFFDVIVPSSDVTLPWVVRTLDQNDLALDNALRDLRAYVSAAGDTKLVQALKRVELQVGPSVVTTARVAGPGGTVSASARVDAAPSDTILQNPQEAYRAEVRKALMDAMLDHSSSLGIGDGEWLTVA